VNPSFHFGPSAKYRRAFSLIELIIVMVIVGAVSAIAIPRYANSYARYRVESAARRIAVDLAYARSEAEATSTQKTVVFNLAQHDYTIPGVTPLKGGAGVYTVELADEPYQCTITAAGFGGPAIAQFDGYGVPLNGGSVSIMAGGLTKIVNLDADTGEATVQ